eukprot:3501999-Prymnesium_polylepis.1
MHAGRGVAEGVARPALVSSGCAAGFPLCVRRALMRVPVRRRRRRRRVAVRKVIVISDCAAVLLNLRRSNAYGSMAM